MFWRITGLSTTSPVDNILDKDNFTLEELLDEDEIIQECKALNARLINFLRERAQVEKLLRYIVEEPPENAEKKQTFKFPFIACEIFTCEVDILLRTLVEDAELMDLLFSFPKPDRSHSTLHAGYFSKVVICLMVRKTTSLFNYIQSHPEIIFQLVDLIGITSIMEVLIRLIGADENMYSNFMDTMPWLEDIDVLEMIVNKFSTSTQTVKIIDNFLVSMPAFAPHLLQYVVCAQSIYNPTNTESGFDSPEVHANAAEILCAVTRYAPPVLAAKICSPSFVGRLFHHALEDSRPKSVLVHSLSVCISLLDPKRLVASSHQAFRSQQSHGSLVTATPETVEGMLESLGNLLKLLDTSSTETNLPTTYGNLQPPFGKHRLKVVEFISVLLTIGSEAAENELIRLDAIKRVIDFFFEYPFNNFLHHHVENVIVSCLESKNSLLIEHLLNECNLIGRILEAEKQTTLTRDPGKPTVPAADKTPPRMGNTGHMTHIANKLIQLGNNISTIQTHLQESSEWVEWHSNVLLKRNATENVYNWSCGRPTSIQDRGRDSDDEDLRDRDYDVAALASNLSQAFRSGIYSNDDIEEAQGSFERDDEDVYFDDESAEVVISSLRLGDDQDSSLFTNSNWFAFESDRANDRLAGSLASPSPNSVDGSPDIDDNDEVVVGEDEDLIGYVASSQVGCLETPGEADTTLLQNGSVEVVEDASLSSLIENEKPPEWVEWRETSEMGDVPGSNPTVDVPNGETELDNDACPTHDTTSVVEESGSSSDSELGRQSVDTGGLPDVSNVVAESAGSTNGNHSVISSESTISADSSLGSGDSAS